MKKQNSIDNIIGDALLFIEYINCPVCKKNVDFHIENKIPKCNLCHNILTVIYEDLKPICTLDKRAGIKRFSSSLGI